MPENSQMKKNKWIRNLFSAKGTSSKIFLVALFAVSTILLFLPFFFDIDFKSLTAFGLTGLFLINFFGSATLFLPAPAIFSVAVAGATINPLLVALIAAIAGALGEAVAYIFGYSSKEVLNLKKHKHIYKYSKIIVHWKKGILIPFFAFFPNPLFDGLGILAGLSDFPIKLFLLYVFLGRFVRNIGIAYLGLFLWV